MTKLVNLPESPIEGANLIAGEWQKPSGERIDVISPWSGESIGSVPQSTQADVDAVVAGAKAAFAEWRRVPLRERTQILYRFRELLLEHLEELAHLDSAECGKTVAEARAGVLKGVEIVEFAASLQNMDDGATMEVSRGVTCETRREPLGVVVGITPFNFPAMVPMWMYPIAVTVGNAFILKPSEKVPFTANRMGQLMLDAGFPPGVFSVIHGGKETVEALCDHPDVEAVGFVGSTPIAKSVYARATSHGKRALCLGGAKNHFIVLPDADPDVTVDGVVRSFTGCAGQRCMAASLMVAVGDVDPLIEKIVEHTRGVRLGVDMGAIIEKRAHERLVADVAQGEREGAKLALDGRDTTAPEGFEGGYWLAPSILDQVTFDMECANRELFGPVLSIVHVKDIDEALALQSRSPYGNAYSVFTTRGATARYVAENSEAAMIGVNIGVPVPREPFSFGGSKQSKFGSHDMTGWGGVDFWTWTKKITTKWSLQPDATWMS
ncbi:MAG: methylmalonate-semialdehyde dehydrogenase (CoA acylating) [Sandaracinus sp.]|nr:methylmalonate-semialdehyde dehydrogenase (CoA acylating) [Sandaracinus sp.]|tara:strand:- start:4425 stop:5906 length:1482 start_codon:yes stop_codon:yes gene_type:complete